jgi:hypothetical protein
MHETTAATLIARVSAGLVVVLAPLMLVASGFVSRALGRGLLVIAAAAALSCLVAAGVLAWRGAEARSGAALLVAGAACVLGGGAYMWSLRHVPSAIPIGGFLAILLGLVLLAVGAVALRPARADIR